MPDKINLRVDGYGFSLLKYNLFDNQIPIEFDIEKNLGKITGNNIIFFSNYHKEAFESDHLSACTDDSVTP